MKILQIINSHNLADGGAQRLAVRFHRAYLERGIDSHLLSLMDSPAEDIPNAHSLGFQTPYHPRVLSQLRKTLRRAPYRDAPLMHVHLFPAQLFVPLALVGRRRRPLLLTTEHNTFNRRRDTRIGRALDAMTYRAYAKIICISEGTRDTMAQWLPDAASKLTTIPNGIDLTNYAPRAARAKSPTSKLIVLSVGRLSEQKNYATAIRAFARLRESNIEYWIAGQAESEANRRELEELIDELQLQNVVKLLGFHADAAALMQQADIFLQASRWEGFGLSAAEAMASGLPVVASDVAGLREVVGKDSGAGLLIDPASPASITDAIDALSRDPDLRQNMGEAALRRAQNFDIDATIESHLALYQSVLKDAAETPR